MIVQVLGPGCANCTKLLVLTEQAVRELALDAKVEKVTDLGAIIGFGVMRTPALAVDGWGTVYLAWAERATGSVKLTAMRLGKQEWTRPVVVAAGDASSPALLVAAGRRLVVGYQQEGRVKLSEYRLLSPQVDPTANDGPDPLGYGKEEGGEDEDDQMNDEPVGDLFEIGVPRSQKEKGL